MVPWFGCRYELEAFQTLVRQKFDLVGQELNATHGAGNWVEIDAGGTTDEVRERIWLAVGGVGAGRSGRLWERDASLAHTSEGQSRS